MAARLSVYEAFPLNISNDEIRVLHLFPKNGTKVFREKDQTLVSEAPNRKELVQRSVKSEPAEAITAPLIEPTKDFHAGLQINDDNLPPLSEAGLLR
jgi:hypothetical protein